MAYVAKMTHRERRQRMRKILERLEAGEVVVNLAIEHGLSPRHIWATANHEKRTKLVFSKIDPSLLPKEN